jgi:hypothetical protein
MAIYLDGATSRVPLPVPNESPPPPTSTSNPNANGRPTPTTQGPAPQTGSASAQTSQPVDQTQAAAQKVLNTGKGSSFLWVHWGENDTARLGVLADELGSGSAQFRTDLMGDLLKSDPNMFGTWFTPAHAAQLGPRQEGDLATAMADAYIHHQMPESTSPAGLAPGQLPPASLIHNVTSLDSLVNGYHGNGSIVPSDIVGNAQNVRQFLDFLNTSTSPDMQTFREQFSAHLLQDYVLNPAVAANNSQEQQAAAGLAAAVLTGGGGSNRPQDPSLAVNALTQVLSGKDQATQAQDLNTIVNAASASGSLFGPQSSVLQNAAGLQHINLSSMTLPDGATQLMLAIAHDKGSDAGALATDLATLPTSSPSLFAGSPDNANALTQAITAHAAQVFDHYAVASPNANPSVDNPNDQAYLDNMQILGGLFHATLFNPDVSSQNKNALQQQVTSYLNAQVQAANKNPVAATSGSKLGTNAEDRLAMMLASLGGGVRQKFVDQADAQAAKDQLIGMVLDTVTSAIPAADFASSKVEKYFENAFSGDPAVQNVLKQISSNGTKAIVDQTQGKLTDSAKAALTNALNADLSADSSGPQSDTSYFNTLLDSVLGSLKNGNSQNVAMGNFNTYYGLYNVNNPPGGAGGG